MRIHRNSRRNVLLWFVAILVAAVFASSSLAAPGRGAPRGQIDQPSGKDEAGPEHRKTLLQAWKESQRARTAARSPLGIPAPPGGTPAVGRPSMVINDSNTVLYTKQFAGSACDPDLGSPSLWVPSTGYAANDHAHPVTGSSTFNFRATNSGTSGAAEPVWPNVFGATVVDGTITWQAEDRTWTANRAYPVGVVVRPSFAVLEFGFNFRVITAGTTGAAEPQWPTTIGATVSDGTVLWQAIGFYPGSFRGCNAMSLVLRASGGAETQLTAEGDPVGGAGSQLNGWSEFYALNNGGQAAFRSVVSGLLSEEDESGSGIFVSGPAPGLTQIAQTNTVIGGRGVCGFGAMVANNNVGQVLFDGYTTTIPLWQPNHVYAPSAEVMPTTGIGLKFRTAGGGTSGATEPAWPSTINSTVADGTVSWLSVTPRGCGEDHHGLYRFTSGTGNELLIALGTDVGGGTTVVGFGNDVVPATGPCATCRYEDADGYLNAAGHTPAVVRLSTGDTAAYLLTGPLTFTQVARTGAAGPGGAFGRVYPRTAVNNADQVLFKAQVGGVDKWIRWTPPSTFAVVATVGDDIGTRSGGAASGTTMTALGFFGDINASGNAVFQATLSSGPKAYYFWNGTTGLLIEIAREGGALPANFASEMVALSDSNVAAFTSGAGPQEQIEEAAELVETGLHTWTSVGGVTNQIRNGDVVNGFNVTGIEAQHPTFRRRQLNNVGCVATQFLANGANPQNAAEGNGTPRNQGVPPGPQLFVGCAGIVPAPTATPTPTGTLSPTSTPTPSRTSTPVGPGGVGPSSPVPTLSETMLALFGLALAAAATLVLLTRKR